MTRQLDMFAEEWADRFERVEVTINEDLQGIAKGPHLAWKCPGCGEIELTEFSLSINHGFDPRCERNSFPFDRPCVRQEYLARRQGSGGAA
jgi:hypothetical protein